VSFDIDANGILTVTAKDKETGKEQKVTISGSTQLSKEEIDRMVSDAQAHADEDKRRREEVEVRNAADSIAYQIERQIRELGSRVPANEKARAEQMIQETRDQLKSSSPDLSRLRQLADDLRQIGYALSSAAYSQTAAGQQGGNGGQREGQPERQPPGAEDVIDAEFKKTG
jgi:molecular chaperone DnaK